MTRIDSGKLYASCGCAVTGRRPVRNIIMLRPKPRGVKIMAAHGGKWDECPLCRRRHR